MTGSVAMRLLNMAILGRAEFQPPPIFPKPSQASDDDVDRKVEFPGVFDGQQSFNSVYLVNDRRYDPEYQVGEDVEKLSLLSECALKCYELPECFYYSAVVEKFDGDALDKTLDVNCILIDRRPNTAPDDGYKPLNAERRRWVAGRMPARNGAKALNKGIADWTQSYPENIEELSDSERFAENETYNYVYLKNFMSAWLYAAHSDFDTSVANDHEIKVDGEVDLGECFDACLNAWSPLKCNAISHGFNEIRNKECYLLYVDNVDEDGPRFEDLDVSAHHSKDDSKSWVLKKAKFNTWRLTFRSKDFPPSDGLDSPWEEYRPDIVPEEWTSQTLTLISPNRRLLNPTETYPVPMMEDCASDCVSAWDAHSGGACRFFSFDQRDRVCSWHVDDELDMSDEYYHYYDFISVGFVGVPPSGTN